MSDCEHGCAKDYCYICLHRERDDLRQRLEAAGRLLACSPNGSRAWCIRRDKWLADESAALAAGEKANG